MNSQPLLTTIDNPFDPFTEFIDWWFWDNRFEHKSTQLLYNNVHISDQMTDEEVIAEYERGIDNIIANDPEHIYVKVYAKE